jgi:hypothetical protein
MLSIYHVVYTIYSWYITGISHPGLYIPGIYLVYTLYISCICRLHTNTFDIPSLEPMGLFSTPFYIDIPLIYQVYSLKMLGISRPPIQHGIQLILGGGMSGDYIYMVYVLYMIMIIC